MTNPVRRMRANRVPDSTALILRMRGVTAVRHPMLDAADELAALHAIRLASEGDALGELDAQRLRLVRAIDRYITLVTPAPGESARRHTETVGAVVDRLANWCTLASANVEVEAEFAEAYVRQLADGLDDLIAGVTTGTCTVPQVYQLPSFTDASGLRLAIQCRRRT